MRTTIGKCRGIGYMRVRTVARRASRGSLVRFQRGAGFRRARARQECLPHFAVESRTCEGKPSQGSQDAPMIGTVI